MSKVIYLREGFSFVYSEENRKTNIIGLGYDKYLVANGWMEIVDFVSILESGLRGKLGTKNKYKIGNDMTIYGILKDEFLINIELNLLEHSTLSYNSVETQQLVSKLNKLLHVANKLYLAKEIELF